MKVSRHRHHTKACTALAIALFFATTVLPACNRTEDEAVAPEAKVEAIEPIEGMKYYVGGPIMKHDKYGRLRLAGFNGEISSPTTRGLLLGFKKNDDGTFDYRTWLNGEIISQSTGFLDEGGLLWYNERVSYDANGDVVVRQKFTYDDDKKVMLSSLDHIDPQDGDVVKTESQEIPYTPPADDEESEDEDDDESDPAEGAADQR